MRDEIFEVSMFGGFALSYKNEPILLWQNRSGKAIGLLQYLIYHQGQSFPKGDLFELLYDYDSDGDPSNTFRVTVHRIKRCSGRRGCPNALT